LRPDTNNYLGEYFNHHESALSYNNVVPQIIPNNVDNEHTITSLSPVPRHHYGSALHVPYVDPYYTPLSSVALQYSTTSVETCHTNGFQQEIVQEEVIQSEPADNDEEETENFGEIIKKGIVETVA
jgi:hypothetical protein